MTAKVGIVGYGMGNVTSLFNAFAAAGVEVFVAEGPARLKEASHIALPGVGAFPRGMENLKVLGFEDALKRLVLEERRPFLGVCLGMQLLATEGEEHRLCAGLNFIPGRVTRLDAKGLRVPHVGWNTTVAARENPLLGPAGASEHFYYVHSYRLSPENAEDVVMECEYGGTFAAAVRRDHIFGVQFHPEKSHAGGLSVLKRFAEAASC